MMIFSPKGKLKIGELMKELFLKATSCMVVSHLFLLVFNKVFVSAMSLNDKSEAYVAILLPRIYREM